MLVTPDKALKPAYGLEWDERRRAYRAKHPKVCAACGDKRGCTLHHKRYNRLVPILDRPGYGRSGGELDGDLTWLCDPGCHERVHLWHDRLFPHDRLPYRWLALVTVVYIAVARVRRRITPTLGFAAGATIAWRIGWWAAALILLTLVLTRTRRAVTRIRQPAGG